MTAEKRYCREMQSPYKLLATRPPGRPLEETKIHIGEFKINPFNIIFNKQFISSNFCNITADSNYNYTYLNASILDAIRFYAFT